MIAADYVDGFICVIRVIRGSSLSVSVDVFMALGVGQHSLAVAFQGFASTYHSLAALELSYTLQPLTFLFHQFASPNLITCVPFLPLGVAVQGCRPCITRACKKQACTKCDSKEPSRYSHLRPPTYIGLFKH